MLTRPRSAAHATADIDAGASTHPAYRPDIDGLRAVAVLSVVVFHAFPDALPGGFVGVDVFFVISGFLISSIIFKGLETGAFSFIDFYKRRVLRIFPALLLVLVATLAFALSVLNVDEQKQIARHVAAGAGFVSNFVLWSESGYFDSAAESKPLLHLWSLAIEEQFYLVWPPLLWAATRRRLSLRGVVVAVAALSFGANVVLFRTDSVADFYSPLTRFWELLAGALLAHATLHGGKASRVARDWVSLAGGCAIVASLVLIERGRTFPGFWALLPVGGAVAIIAGGAEAWLNRTLLSRRALVWIGLISFPLYIWHWPLLAFARLLESATPAAPLRAGAVAAAVVLAFLTYRFVERPLRFGARRNGKAIALTIAMALVGCAGLGVAVLKKIPPPLTAAQAALAWTDADKFDPVCHRRFGRKFPYCRMSADRDATVALIGDSFANAYFPGVSREYARRGENLVMLGAAGCPPLLDIVSGYAGQKDSCRGRTSDALRAVADTPSIKTVILAANWSLYVTGARLFHPEPWEIKPQQGGGSNVETSRAQLGAAIDLLTKAGKTIVLLKQTPELDFDPATCATGGPRLATARPPKCEMRSDEAKAFLRSYERVFDAFVAQRSHVKVVDPVPALCPADKCILFDGDLPIYRDDLHLSRHGSEFMAEHLDLFGAR
jgi:peptidoglycan/LPS O-acetylase OafA/YrhL